jgi:outer membrane lipoprotein SlyB
VDRAAGGLVACEVGGIISAVIGRVKGRVLQKWTGLVGGVP